MADELETQEVEQGERPDWLPENFRSPEALVESYKEAQRALTALQEENKERERAILNLGEQIEELRAQLEETQAQTAQQPTNPLAEAPDLSFDPLYHAYEQAYMEGDAQKLFLLTRFMQYQAAQEVAKQQGENQGAQRALDPHTQAKLIDNFVAEEVGPEWQETKPLVGRLIEENPQLAPQDDWSIQDTVRHLALLAKMAPAVYQGGEGAARRNDEAQQAKRIAQTLRASGINVQSVTPSERAKQIWNQIKNADLGSWSVIVSSVEKSS
jgi:hypothetical protein